MSVVADDCLVMRGRLDMATVPALYDTGLKQLNSSDLRVDLSEVEAVDSAAISMLLGWLRASQRSGKKLLVSGLPEDLLSLARLYGVAEMLPPQVA